MPNHITNIIKASAPVIAALKGESLVDFNSVIPMPESLKNVTCDGRAESLAKLLTGQINLQPKAGDFLAGLTLSNVIRDLSAGGIKGFRTDEEFETFVTMLRNFRQHGHLTWYDWGCAHWGTKWNAYHSKDIAGGIQFDTAWSAPHPVLAAIAAKHPDERIEHSWADEDIGNNCGHTVYRLGATTKLPIEDPVDFALTLTGSDREYYRVSPTTGKWEYHDADEKS